MFTTPVTAFVPFLLEYTEGMMLGLMDAVKQNQNLFLFIFLLIF